MNAPVSSANPIADALRQVAMVAEISTSAIGLTRTDKMASRQADQNHSAKDGAGKVVVNRFAGADEEIRDIMRLQVEAANNLRSHTSQWGTSKRRLLPNANFQKWLTRHTQIADQFKDKVAEVVAKADDIIARAAQNIGSYQIDLPTKQEIEHAFALEYNLEPIPDAKEFGAIMGDNGQVMSEANAHLQWQFEQNIAASYNAATQDAAERLAGPLEKLIERMGVYEQREKDEQAGKNVGKEGYFRDTIITNVHDIAGVFGALNVLGDPHLATIAKKVEPLLKVDADLLRKNAQVRTAVVARAQEIMRDLDAVLVR